MFFCFFKDKSCTNIKKKKKRSLKWLYITRYYRKLPSPFLCLWPPLPLASFYSSHNHLPYGSRAGQSGSQWKGFSLVFSQPGFFFLSWFSGSQFTGHLLRAVLLECFTYRSPRSTVLAPCVYFLRRIYPCSLGFISLSVICLFLFSPWALVPPNHLLPFPPTLPGLLRGCLLQAAIWPDQLQQLPKWLSIRYKWRWVGSLKMIPTIGSFWPDGGFHLVCKDFQPPPPTFFSWTV